jgi:hypothetical protein
MKELLSNFVEALRHEMQQYGEILARLDHEQAAIANHGPQAILSSITAINAQTQVIEESRQHRLSVQQEVARRLDKPEQAPLLELLPSLPAPYSLLIRALVTENNELLERIRDRAEQNHLNLKRSAELMCHVVGKLGNPASGAQLRVPDSRHEIAESGTTKTAA